MFKNTYCQTDFSWWYVDVGRHLCHVLCSSMTFGSIRQPHWQLSRTAIDHSNTSMHGYGWSCSSKKLQKPIGWFPVGAVLAVLCVAQVAVLWLCYVLRWPQIQRYLFEGSVLKETKGKGTAMMLKSVEHCGSVGSVLTGGITDLNKNFANLDAFGDAKFRHIQLASFVVSWWMQDLLEMQMPWQRGYRSSICTWTPKSRDCEF